MPYRSYILSWPARIHHIIGLVAILAMVRLPITGIVAHPQLLTTGHDQPSVPVLETRLFLPGIMVASPVYVESQSVGTGAKPYFFGPFYTRGEAVIRNTLPITVYDVVVAMQLYNQDTGALLGVLTTTIDLPAIFPGQTTIASGGFDEYWHPEPLMLHAQVIGWSTERFDESGQVQHYVPLTVLTIEFEGTWWRNMTTYIATLRNDTAYRVVDGGIATRCTGNGGSRIMAPIEPGATSRLIVLHYSCNNDVVGEAQGLIESLPTHQR